MSNLSQFLGGGGGGLTPKFQEFTSSGTFTPSQALIDAGGYIEVFLVAAGGALEAFQGAAGGETILKTMYLTSTTGISVTIGAGVFRATGGNSVFSGSSAGGVDLTAKGGRSDGLQIDSFGAGWGGNANNSASAGNGVFGYGVGGGYNQSNNGVRSGPANSGQSGTFGTGASGYCLIKWFE